VATVRTITLIDDLEGGTADETVSFALDGVSYEIDLSSKNADGLRKALAPYIDGGRRSGKAPRARARAARGSVVVDKEQNVAIRTWAHSRGISVNKRGRIPAEVVEKYHAANA
jgi:hypothetical protein